MKKFAMLITALMIYSGNTFACSDADIKFAQELADTLATNFEKGIIGMVEMQSAKAHLLDMKICNLDQNADSARRKLLCNQLISTYENVLSLTKAGFESGYKGFSDLIQAHDKVIAAKKLCK